MLVLGESRMEAKQGQFAQAEADARRALIARLKDQGKYSMTTPEFIMGLVGALSAEGRFSDAEKLTRVAIEIDHTVGVLADSQTAVARLSNLGTILMLQHKANRQRGLRRDRQGDLEMGRQAAGTFRPERLAYLCAL